MDNKIKQNIQKNTNHIASKSNKSAFSTSIKNAEVFNSIEQDIATLLQQFRELINGINNKSKTSKDEPQIDELCDMLKSSTKELEAYVKSFVIDGKPIFVENEKIRHTVQLLKNSVPGLNSFVLNMMELIPQSGDMKNIEFIKSSLLNSISQFEQNFKVLKVEILNCITRLKNVAGGSEFINEIGE